MLELKNVFEKIVENRKLNKDDIEKNKLEDERDCRFYTLEGVNLENGEEEKYLIYDCVEKIQTLIMINIKKKFPK